jgi:hypothetical protein
MAIDVKHLARTIPLSVEELKQRYEKSCAGSWEFQSGKI